jgi:serine/threonine-protein kinase
MDGMEKRRYFGCYEILEELGRGSTGIVYKVRHVQIGWLVALKILVPKPGHEESVQRRRFLREAQAMAACNHPNIVRVHEVGEHNGQPYIVREFVDGETLRAQLEKKLFSEREACRIVETLSRPIEYMHNLSLVDNLGLVHRNLNPANVLIALDGTLKLIGFGNARPLSGSPPETVATDIQCLGAMLFTLVTGEYWFPEGRLPEELAKICKKSSNAEPENQYHSAMELAEDLRRYLQ